MTAPLTNPASIAEDPSKAAARVRAARSRERKRVREGLARRAEIDGVTDAAIVASLLNPAGLDGVDLEARRRMISTVLVNAGPILKAAGCTDFRDRIVTRATALRTAQIQSKAV